MKTLQVLFSNESAEPRSVLDSIRYFEDPKSILVCSQSATLKDELEALSKEVYTFIKPIKIDLNTLNNNVNELSKAVRDYIVNEYSIKFNITFAGPYEAYIAYTCAQRFSGIYIGALNAEENLKQLNLKPAADIDSLSEEEQLLLLAIGEQPAGISFSELKNKNITTSRKILSDRGLNRLLGIMEGKYIRHEILVRDGAGKRPYLWKLTSEGAVLFDDNLDTLRIRRVNSEKEYDRYIQGKKQTE